MPLEKISKYPCPFHTKLLTHCTGSLLFMFQSGYLLLTPGCLYIRIMRIWLYYITDHEIHVNTTHILPTLFTRKLPCF
jgi:hypothetical protein